MSEPRPRVELRFHNITNRWGESRDEVEVLVNGNWVTGGSYGGEPEDNKRCRDYRWVEVALQRLAEALGAQVVTTEQEGTDET